jgi:hypothetical protein
MLSITKTSSLLHISKFRLLKLLEQENITTTKSGNKKLISDEQIEQLKQVIDSQRQADFFTSTSSSESIKQVSTKIDLDFHKEVVKELKEQIVYLQQQLEDEKKERSELSKGILAVQSQMFKVQQALEVRSSTKKESFIQRMFSFS